MRARLILFAIVAVALPTGLFIRHASTERERLLHDAESQVLSLSRNWAERQAEVLEQASAMLDAASRVPAIHDLDPVGCQPLMRDLPARHPWIVGLSVVAGDGSLVCSSNADALPEGPLSAWSFLDDLETARALSISEFAKARHRSQQLYFVGVPLVAGKAFKGALVVALDPSWVGDASSRVGMASSLESMVIDRFGSIVAAQPVPGGRVADRLPHSLVSRLSIESEGVSLEHDGQGIERIYTFRQIPSTGAKLVIDISRDDVLGAEEHNFRQTLLLLGLAAVLAVLLAGVGAEYVIFRWIDLLTKATRRIGEEDSPDLAIPRGAGEFALLAQAFNLMSHRLKSRQRALALSEARFRDIAETSGDWFWERDAEFRLSYLSERFSATTGVDAELILRRTLDEQRPLDLFQTCEDRAAVEAAFAARAPFRDQVCRIRRPDGEIRWWRLSGKPIYDQSGTFVGYRGSGSDVTDAKVAADELRRNEEKLHRIASNVPGLVFQFRYEADGWSSYPYVSERVQELYGVSQAEVYASPDAISSRVHPEDLPAMQKNFEISRKSLQPWSCEYRIFSNGHWRWLQIQSIPEAQSDGAIIWDGVAIEITTLKDQESQLRGALAAAEAANIAKRDFLATMSHELRTPLNAIIGFSRIMVDEMLGPMGNELYLDYARDVQQSGQHLLSLIDGILDLSRVEADHVKLDEGPVDLGAVARFSASLQVSRAEEAGVRLECRTAPNIPLVIGDEVRLRQIVANLLTNAIKFTPAGGEVTISAAATPDGKAAIVIRDTGIGIADENLSRVFEPFFQVDSSLSRTLQEGVGLGLPLARRWTELNHGTLELTSELGSGTTVTITFPAGLPDALAHADDMALSFVRDQQLPPVGEPSRTIAA